MCEPYPPPVVSLVEAYGQILALAIQNAQERDAGGSTAAVEPPSSWA